MLLLGNLLVMESHKDRLGAYSGLQHIIMRLSLEGLLKYCIYCAPMPSLQIESTDCLILAIQTQISLFFSNR